MPNTKDPFAAKDPFADLDIDISILKPEIPRFELTNQEPTLDEKIEQDSQRLARIMEARQRLTRHLRRGSLQIEKDEWMEQILTAPSDEIEIHCGPLNKAKIKRIRLYQARSAMIAEATAAGDSDDLDLVSRLSEWSFSLEHKNDGHYVVGIRNPSPSNKWQPR